MERYGDIHALPENCIANVLSLTSPKDVCRLAAVASSFWSASQSDTVWGRFLPSDYRDIIPRDAGSDSIPFNSMKEIYLHLCDHPILIDGGRKSFWLEKSTGKKCYMLSARELDIVWSDNSQYWRWVSLPESRFPEVAELLNVCWFEVRGKINRQMLSPGTTYATYLVFTCKSRLSGFVFQPIEAFVVWGGHEEGERRKICLDMEGAQQRKFQLAQRRLLRDANSGHRIEYPNTRRDGWMEMEYPKKRSDGWMEVELGEYIVMKKGCGELEMCLMEVSNGNWKSGLIIQGIQIRPKNIKK